MTGTGRWRRLLGVVACCLVLAACQVTTDPSAPEPPIAPAQPVTGVLVDPSGRPVSGMEVTLDENQGVADTIFGGIAFLFTFGLSCLAGEFPCHRAGAASTTTDASGAFTFPATAVTKARGRSRGVILTAGGDGLGILRVQVDPGQGGDLGTLPFWDPHPVATAAGTDLTLHWSAPPGANGRTELNAALVDASATGTDATDTLAQTSDEGTTGSGRIDLRSIEDQRANLVLTAGFSRPRAGQTPRIDWTAPLRSVTGAGAPVSRGAHCRLTGMATPATCPLTNGDLLTPLCPPAPGACASSATIDLGRALPGGLIAVRGDGQLSIECSTDDVTFRPMASASVDGDWNAMLLSTGGPLRYVRLSGDLRDADVSQVSVWPLDTPAITPGAAAPQGNIPALPVTATSKGGVSAALTVLAVAVLAVVLVGLGVVLGRRRRP